MLILLKIHSNKCYPKNEDEALDKSNFGSIISSSNVKISSAPAAGKGRSSFYHDIDDIGSLSSKKHKSSKEGSSGHHAL